MIAQSNNNILTSESTYHYNDGLTGADSIQDAIELQKQLHEFFTKGGFLLRKWNSSEPAVLDHIPADFKAFNPNQQLPDPDQYTKTLGIELNARQDHFHLTVTNITKRALVSDIPKTYDILGWFSTAIIKVKILSHSKVDDCPIGSLRGITEFMELH